MNTTEKEIARLIKADMSVVQKAQYSSVLSNAAMGFSWINFTIAGGAEDLLKVPNGNLCYLIPIVGSASVTDSMAVERLVHAEEVLQIGTGIFRIKNVFEKDSINVLAICFDAPAAAEHAAIKLPMPLSEKNRLLLGKNLFRSIMFGFFDSRTKYRVKLESTSKNALAFVVNGSFELEERMLEYRDVLVLQNYSEIEFKVYLKMQS